MLHLLVGMTVQAGSGPLSGLGKAPAGSGWLLEVPVGSGRRWEELRVPVGT